LFWFWLVNEGFWWIMAGSCTAVFFGSLAYFLRGSAELKWFGYLLYHWHIDDVGDHCEA
jgi:hypothetical protein